ncbi:MurR/RpiR family transcriptional regulator [Alicyclobacillus pomorum]|uniref:MurR/RpiR family transcriptional regulator n=1 Tax=Alicyclobacillus pomorum TaxID=204470 RepID=UPI0004132CDF|nr:MurR/RpiR family transcriptional regulator [Alicyclobacillus pomorum]
MQETEVLKRITEKYPTMSASQQRIADVILQDPETAAFFNVAQLAKQAGVSDSTVTRFSTFLGYTGFPALSQQLQAMVRLRLTTKERLERSQSIQHEDEASIFFSSLEDDVQNLKLMIHQLDAASLRRSADMLDRAEKIALVCSRSAVALGVFFEFYLNIFGKQPMVLTGEPRTMDVMNRFGPSDVVVGIGFSRYSRFTVDSLRYFKNLGVPTIAITDYASSPLSQYALETLYCPTGIASHMDSFVAPLALIQALLRCMAQHVSSEQMKNLEQMWEHLDVYFKPRNDKR